MIIGFIPSRLESKRIYQKPLVKIDGLPIIIHTMKRAMLSKKLDDLYVCTNSKEISDLVNAHGGKSIITSSKHRNGTERIAEAVRKVKCKQVIDIQGDEPMVMPNDIDKVIEFHKRNNQFEIVVPYVEKKNEENTNDVKILSNYKGKILFFSRSLCPHNFNKKKIKLKKHLSIISFKRKALLKFNSFNPSPLEKIEGIELMRALENDFKLGTFKLNGESLAVDVKKDISRVFKYMKKDKIRKLY